MPLSVNEFETGAKLSVCVQKTS